jgi:transcriptional regulator with XRE-family HTH domain
MQQKNIERGSKFAARRFGKLLRDERVRSNLSQAELGERLNKNQSYIGMLETGERGPPDYQVVAKIIRVLKPHPLQMEEFRLAAQGATRLLDSNLISLDSIGVAMEIAIADCRMIWIVGHEPLECEETKPNPVYDVVLENIRIGKTRYIYWLPNTSAHLFDTLRTRLQKDLRKKEDLAANYIVHYLECIIAPEILCAHQFAIYDPLDPKRIGRFRVQAREGAATRVVPMKESYTDKLFRVMRPVYDALVVEKEHHPPREETAFRKHYP